MTASITTHITYFSLDKTGSICYKTRTMRKASVDISAGAFSLAGIGTP
jgi:hypothetical protein